MTDSVDLPVVWLRTFDEVREAMQRDETFVQAGYDEAKPDLFGGTLLTLDGQEHRLRRRLEQRLFSAMSVRGYDEEIVPPLVLDELSRLGTAPFDLVEVARRINTRIATVVVGIDDCEDRDRLDRLADLMTALHSGVVVRWSTRPHAEVLAEAKAAKAAFAREYFAPSIARRREARSAGEREQDGGAGDLLTLLVEHEEVIGPEEETYLREAVHYLIASAHTASNGLTHAVADLQSWLAEHPEDRPRVQDRVFLRRCAAETFRLHAPTAVAYRAAVEDAVLRSSGASVRQGQLVALDLVSAGRDASYYGEDGDRFDPHRAVGPAHAVGLSFSVGVHSCPGRQLSTGTASRGAPGRTGDAAVASETEGTQEGTQGILARILAGLYAAGVESAGPPTLWPDSERPQYAHYPLRLTDPPASPSGGSSSRGTPTMEAGS